MNILSGNKDMNNSFSGKVKELGIISVIVIIVISYSLFFYLQNIIENNIKIRLFDQKKQRQVEPQIWHISL
jgi:hypothetical protein